jgi:hypothetical protein
LAAWKVQEMAKKKVEVGVGKVVLLVDKFALPLEAQTVSAD